MKDKPGKERSRSSRNPPSKRVLAKLPEDAGTELEPVPEGTLEVQPPAEQPAPEELKRRGGPRKRESKGHVERTGEPADRPTKRRYGTPGATVSEERLRLPPDGLVAMSRSGGLRFTSRDVIVYKNGLVEIDHDPALSSTGAKATRILNDQELAELYRVLDAINFAALTVTSGRPNPDAYAYEIVARIGGADNSVEAFDGSIPEQLSPLIRLLSAFLRSRRGT
jgi:hypothetical protein